LYLEYSEAYADVSTSPYTLSAMLKIILLSNEHTNTLVPSLHKLATNILPTKYTSTKEFHRHKLRTCISTPPF